MDFQLNIDTSITRENKTIDENKLYDLIVVGGGPAGLNSALYGARNGLDVGIITEIIGGQVMDTSSVDNYLGYQSLTGEALVNKFKNHVDNYNIFIKTFVRVVKIEKNNQSFNLYLSDGTILKSTTVIIASGSKARKLNVLGEKEYSGKGVAYCAICDGAFYKNKVVAIAGGGNSAVEAGLDLSKIAKKVIIVQRSVLKAEKILIDNLKSKSNVKILLGSEIQEIYGDSTVKGIKVYNRDKDEITDINIDGLFVEIGSIPNSEPFKDLVKRSATGEIEIDNFCRTSEEGIFAAGDVTNVAYKQISISVGEGAKAALSASAYINKLEKQEE